MLNRLEMEWIGGYPRVPGINTPQPPPTIEFQPTDSATTPPEALPDQSPPTPTVSHDLRAGQITHASAHHG